MVTKLSPCFGILTTSDRKDRKIDNSPQRTQRKTKNPTLYNWGITFSCYRNKMVLIISSIFSLRSLRLCGSNKLRS